MSSWIGMPGALVEIVCPAKEDVTSDRTVTEMVPFSGERIVQLGKRVRRSWSLEHGAKHPRDLAVLDALTRWESPLVWVGALAQTTNLLTPEQAAMVDTGFLGGASSRTGILPVGGTVVVSWAGGPVGGIVNVTGGKTVPVRAGVPVTFSAWTQRADPGSSTRFTYTFRDPAGATVSTATLAGPAGTGLQRASWTVTPPTGAADVSLWVRDAAVVAAPQFTWTPAVTDWAPGRGVAKVVVIPGSESVITARPDQTLVSAAYTILEVG